MPKRSPLELTQEREAADATYGQRRFPLIAMLHDIRSMHNVGAIFRTADAARIGAVYLTGYTAVPPRPEIDKTALGATQRVPWKHFDDPRKALARARSLGFRIAALEQTHDAVRLEDCADDGPLLLMLGNEVWGLPEDLCATADMALEIPMYGSKQSLNVSVAFGIAAYKLIADRRPLDFGKLA
jgi:23S rRNA (guanosine2251-2'-O)-methyltransferase